MKRGEVYIVDLGETLGSEQKGKRPCVIIQNDVGNEKSSTTIIAPLTEREKKNLPTHIQVSEYDEKVSRCSTIMLEQVRTIAKARVGDFIGKLSEDTMQKVDEALKVSLALNKEETRLSETVIDTEIPVKEYKGQRVVTFKDIDDAHKRIEGTARKRFADNKERFIEGEDFFIVTPKDLENAEMSEKRTLENDVTSNRGTTFITEQGYLMLVKSFTDDLSWKVQREIVNGYFRAKLLSKIEAIKNLDERLTVLENTMTLDYRQQRKLENAVNERVTNILSGKGSPAYKAIGRKVFAECNGNLKNYFKVNARGDVPRKRCKEAISYAENWNPCESTKEKIKKYNKKEESKT